MRTDKRKTGDFGEEIASRFLMKLGHEIIERNYQRKWGEIDIISKFGNTYHFNEVKTEINFVSREIESWDPEEKIHPMKLKRLSRAIQTYLLERNIENEWRFNAIVIIIDEISIKTKIKFIENIVL